MNRIAPISLLALVAGLSACSGGSLEDARYLTGSSTIVADAAYDRVAVVHTWEGMLGLVDRAGNTELVPVGDEPTRVARVGDRFIVTLRGERAIAEVDGNTAELLRTVPTTGPEPYAVVATESGDRVYVSISQGSMVEERDGETLEVLRRFEVRADPRWMALHPSGESLVVAHGTGQVLTNLDLIGGVAEDFYLPEHQTDVFVAETGQELTVHLSGRVTGDPTFTPDGSTLAVPAYYVDNVSGEQGTGGVPSFPYYQSAQTTTLGRFNATIALYRVRGSTHRPDAISTQLVADFSSGDFSGAMLRSYITSVTPTPDGLAWLATMEASDAVMLVDATADAQRPADDGGVAFPNIAVAITGRGPRGLAMLDRDRMLTHTFLQNGVQDINYSQVREEARFEINNGGAASARPVTASSLAIQMVPSALSTSQLQGARNFYSAAGATMGQGGVSCSTCHFEGRTDGLTWKLMSGERQTPSLAGKVSETAPVTWTEDVPTVAAEAQFTAQFRMGAGSLEAGHASDIAAFVDFIDLPDLPDIDDAEALARGKAIFEREDVACASCHSGEALTDGEHHDLYGLVGVNTPTLRGISATAPYLHDGTAATLRDVLVRSRNGSMGNTGMLSDQEMDDLELYLKSL